MIRSIYGVDQYSRIVGALVIACFAVFVAAVTNAGLVKAWFQPPLTLHILLPEGGVSGLSVGAEIQVFGTRAGEIRRIVIEANQRMQAVARIDNQMRPFIRRDSPVSIRRQFGVAGAAFIDIGRGTGAELDWSYAVVEAGSERAATDTIGQLIDEVRAKAIPLIDDVQKAVRVFTLVAERAVDPKGPLEQTMASVAGIARRVEQGEGLAGRLVSDDRMAANLDSSLVSLRELTGQLERTSKDPRIPEILQKVNAIASSLQVMAQGLAKSTPTITQNVASTSDMLPMTLLQAQIAARELELLLAQLRHHWLLGGGGNAAPATGSRVPSAQVRP